MEHISKEELIKVAKALEFSMNGSLYQTECALSDRQTKSAKGCLDEVIMLEQKLALILRLIDRCEEIGETNE